MQIRSIKRYEDFCALKEKWQCLFGQIAEKNIFLSWQWFDLCWRHYSEEAKPLIVIVEDDERVIAIAPLMNTSRGMRSFGRKLIGFLDANDNADYRDFLVSKGEEKSIELVFDYLLKKKRWAKIDLKRICGSSPNAEAIRGVCAGIDRPYVYRTNCVSPRVQIKGTWEDYYSGLSKGLRQDIRTSINKFAKSGHLCFEVADKETLQVYLDELFHMHGKRQRGKAGISVFEGEQNQAFFRDVVGTFTNLGLCEISVLKIDEKIISAVLGLTFNDTYYYWIPSFDPGYVKYSPGKLHLYYLMQSCFQHGFKLFDFMIGDEAYKLRWANDSVNVIEIKVFSGKMTYLLNSLAWSVKACLKFCKRKSGLLDNIWKSVSKNRSVMKLSQT